MHFHFILPSSVGRKKLYVNVTSHYPQSISVASQRGVRLLLSCFLFILNTALGSTSSCSPSSCGNKRVYCAALLMFSVHPYHGVRFNFQVFSLPPPPLVVVEGCIALLFSCFLFTLTTALGSTSKCSPSPPPPLVVVEG